MGVRARLVCLGIGAAIGLAAATQVVAWRYQFQPALGWGLMIGDGAKLYPPWDFLIWAKTWGQLPKHQSSIGMGVPFLMLGLLVSLFLIKLFDSPDGAGGSDLGIAKKRRRSVGWGDRKALIKAGLTKDQGVVFGRLDPEGPLDRLSFIAPDLLVSGDMRPMLVTGGTRSGKGRGIVVPTLLNWNWSALIFDPKAELWATSAGFRKSLGPTLFFNPRSPYTARFNPLAEISPGDAAVGQVKRLVEILIEPGGREGPSDFWDKQGADMLQALILHVLYTASVEEKNLVTVRNLSADLDLAAAQMIATRHIPNPKATTDNSKEPSHICHPDIVQAARAYASAHEKGRKSVQMTVRSYLNWISGHEIEYAISASDFRIGDLMCNPEPVSLYVQVSPGDLKSLQPLVRLFFHLASTSFTTHMETDSDGRPKEHALLMALDEFPLLGKVSFFEDVVRLASGYGIKCLFIAQSLNDISRVYGVNNGFLDNTQIYVAFAALDPVTREKVSKLTGHVTETRLSSSLPHHFSGSGGSRTLAEVERPLLDVAEVGALPDDKQLIFIAGHRPYLLPKLRYDKVGWLAKRANRAVPDQTKQIDTPEKPGHPWAGIESFGFDPEAEVSFAGESGGMKYL
ncbi:type IV secretory system conjugative DNA transfer family protein, partial [Aquidulcibacter sp.]|uniref:type IV secretory system conjugative DNA transfer family protein n=1 Tax=Aquidulcibacter sp. TaxID=2052990 RepID=UPI0025BAD9C6